MHLLSGLFLLQFVLVNAIDYKNFIVLECEFVPPQEPKFVNIFKKKISNDFAFSKIEKHPNGYSMICIDKF